LYGNHYFVKYYLLSTLLFLFTHILSRAQIHSDTTLSSKETISPQRDSLIFQVATAPSYRQVLQQNPFFNFFASPVVLAAIERVPNRKEPLFYLLCALVLLLAFVKTGYSKYFNNMMTVAFSASLKQKQLREQLMQSPLPSLFLNILFVLVVGVYINFIIQHYAEAPNSAFNWLQLAYCVAVVSGVYLFKYIILTFCGWIFNIKEAANVYLFVVFLVNKLIGIFLLPMISIMAFASTGWWTVLSTVSYILIGGFIIYRFIVSYAPLRREVKVSQFQFFVYLCAFEITPMILIYREFLKVI
jgi:Domain of unknown function (DUF4271)